MNRAVLGPSSKPMSSAGIKAIKRAKIGNEA